LFDSVRNSRNIAGQVDVDTLLASTTYVGLLEGSLFDSVRNSRNIAGQVDVDTLLQGSRNLRLGESTSWKWQVEDGSASQDYTVYLHQLILKLNFSSLTVH
jgi:hydroxymethylglutaryl-CoA reductase (NADPH)